jgi:opacity protein-like surface antigen
MRAALVLLLLVAPQVALADDAIPRSACVSIGRAQPQSDPQLSDQNGHWGFAAGMTWRYSRHVAFELDVVDTGQEAEMPAVDHPAPGARQRAHINVDGIGARVRLIYPAGKLEPFVGLGVGFYHSEISDLGTLFHLVLPTDFAKRSDGNAGVQYVVGFDYAVSPTSALGLEYRWLSLEANFGPEFGGATKVGGGMLLITYRMYSAPRAGFI